MTVFGYRRWGKFYIYIYATQFVATATAGSCPALPFTDGKTAMAVLVPDTELVPM